MRQDEGRPRAAAARGFTLIELMVVIVIIGLLMSIVLPNIRRADRYATDETAKAQMRTLADTVEMYLLQNRALPRSLEDLTSVDHRTGLKYIDRIPTDPWHQPYEYAVVNEGLREYEIRSAGADGRMGTDDDLVHPPKERQ